MEGFSKSFLQANVVQIAGQNYQTNITATSKYLNVKQQNNDNNNNGNNNNNNIIRLMIIIMINNSRFLMWDYLRQIF